MRIEEGNHRHWPQKNIPAVLGLKENSKLTSPTLCKKQQREAQQGNKMAMSAQET